MDSTAGRVLGITLAEYFLARATINNRTSYLDRSFHGAALTAEDGYKDFDPNESLDMNNDKRKYIGVGKQWTIKPAETLKWLWKRAAEEWKYP
jgi:hypothetical protein